MKSQKIFRLFGIDIQLHYSWYLIFILLTWSLATAYFPLMLPNQTTQTYWITGAVAAIFLFISVLLHELSHSLVARIKKIKVESITLFFFGGVAGITKEDMKPSSEFFMAIAGPIFSLILAGIFYLITYSNVNGIVAAITLYLGRLNLILAIFNLVPGYPLDGGRAFRAILYAYYKDLRKATRIAAGAGKFVAMLLVVLGFIGIFSGLGNGLWFILLGAFLYFIANVSYQQVIVRETLLNLSLKPLISKPTPLSPNMKFAEFISKHKNDPHEVYIVKDNSFTGILDIKRITKLPKKLQDITKLKQVAMSVSQIKPISSKDNVYEAFKKLATHELLPVMKDSKYVGVVYRSAVLNRLMAELKFSDGKNHRIAKKLRR